MANSSRDWRGYGRKRWVVSSPVQKRKALMQIKGALTAIVNNTFYFRPFH